MGLHVRGRVPIRVEYRGRRHAVEARREEVEEEVVGAVEVVKQQYTLDLGEGDQDMLVLAVVGVGGVL